MDLARTHWKRTLLLVLIALLFGSVLKRLQRIEHGPFFCESACQVATPWPDPATVALLEDHRIRLDRLKPLHPLLGSRYLVCNSVACVAYHLTLEGEFVGEQSRQRETWPVP